MDSSSQVSRVLMVHLLGRCNLECRHCYMEGSPHRREVLMPALVHQAIQECPKLGIRTLFLTGGEPLLYRGLDEILETAFRTSELRTTVCTNGTLLTPRRAARFHDLKLRVNISIDGPPEFHDRFRNRSGAFAAAERGVHAAIDAGVPVTIITTISRANLTFLEFLVDWAANAGAEQYFAQPLLNLGRGTKIADDCLTFAEVNRLILQLTDLANRPRYQKIRCHVIGAKRQFLLQHPCGAYVCNGKSCHRGVEKEIKKLVIREDGTILPEVPNLSHRYALGNLADAPLSELVDRYYEHGYGEFDRLCRTAYTEILPKWECAIVPWEQIIAERSQSWLPAEECPKIDPECFSCTRGTYGTWRQPSPRAEELQIAGLHPVHLVGSMAG